MNVAVLIYSTFDEGLQTVYFKTDARAVSQLPEPSAALLRAAGFEDNGLDESVNEWAKWHDVIVVDALPPV